MSNNRSGKMRPEDFPLSLAQWRSLATDGCGYSRLGGGLIAGGHERRQAMTVRGAHVLGASLPSGVEKYVSSWWDNKRNRIV